VLTVGADFGLVLTVTLEVALSVVCILIVSAGLLLAVKAVGTVMFLVG